MRILMRKMQSMNAVVMTAVLLFSASSGWAQDDSFPNFYFITPLSLQSGREFGVLDGTTKVDDTTAMLTAPTFKLWRPSPRGDVSLTYEPQFQLFAHHGHLSSWNHQAGLKGNYTATPRWSLDVSDLFVATRDNNLRFDSAFLLPRGPYKENAAFLKLNYDMNSATRIKLHFDNAFVSFREDHVARPLFFSRLTNTYGLTAEHRLNPKVKLTGDYSYLRSHSFDKFDQFGFLVAPYPPTHVASLTYDYNVTPRLLLEVSGGYVRNTINSYVASGLVEKHFNRAVIAGGFSRYLSMIGSPATAGIQPDPRRGVGPQSAAKHDQRYRQLSRGGRHFEPCRTGAHPDRHQDDRLERQEPQGNAGPRASGLQSSRPRCDLLERALSRTECKRTAAPGRLAQGRVRWNRVHVFANCGSSGSPQG